MSLVTRKTVAEMLLSPDFDNILIACHANPDGDAVGSAWSLCAALRMAGKSAKCFCADRIGQDFSYISSKCTDGDFEIEKYVTCDVASVELLGDVDFADKIDIAIDHHEKHTEFAKISCIDGKAASCGEIVLDIIRLMNIDIDEYIASALYTAISTDTGCFRYSNTKRETFEAAAYLSGCMGEGEMYRITKKLFETKSKKRLNLEAYTIQNTQYLHHDKVGYIMFSISDRERISAQYWDLDPLINVIRQVEGIEMSIVAKEKENGVFKISVRTELNFDAAEFCVQFGGGGHKRAAGCTILGTKEEVEEKIFNALERLNF